jgi:adenylate cyclase
MLPGDVISPALLAGSEVAAEVELRPESCSSDEIRAELRRVLGSSQFDASERNRRFLEYVVEETLAGRAGRIKAYNIATQVFGRDVDFDPQMDPVVRMEARRLRRSLERFYLTDGRNSLIRIAMPKGGYVPEFQHPAIEPAPKARIARQDASDDFHAHEYGSSILVAPFDAEGDESIFLHFNRGFADQIVVGLSRFPEIEVFGSGAISWEQQTREGGRFQPDSGIDFVLSGSTALYGGVLNVKAVLAQARTGRVVWGQRFERELASGDILHIRDDIADAITRILAEPYGVIFKRNARVAEGKAVDALTSMECLIRFYQYRRSYRRDLFPEVRGLLEQLVIAKPDYGEAFGCLSHLYCDGYRFGFELREPPAMLLQRALELAERAIELAPDSSRGHHAKGVAFWLLNDVPGSLESMQTALALNPNATEVMAELGLFLSLLGAWDRGVPLLKEAFARNPAEFGLHHIGLSLHHFVNGRYNDALAEACQIHAPDVAYGSVAKAISLIRLGHRAEASDAVRRITEIARLGGRANLGALGVQSLNPGLAAGIVAALRDAGLTPELIRY